MGTTVRVIIWLQTPLILGLLSLRPVVGQVPDDVLGFRIDRENPGVNVLEAPFDVEGAATRHRKGNLRWFYPHRVRHEGLDSNNVALTPYSFGSHRNPVDVAQTALAFYNDYLDSESTVHLDGFTANLEWLSDNHDDGHYYRYGFDWTHGGVRLQEGWVSAMAQGEALAVFSRAYWLTRDSLHLESAARVFDTLVANNDSTWTIARDENGYYWMEEYPNPQFCHVLNGKIIAMWGLWDYYVVSGDGLALTLFRAGMRTIIDHAHMWNQSGRNGSKYCLHSSARASYHRVHLTAFDAYATLLGIDAFREMASLYTREGVMISFPDRALPEIFAGAHVSSIQTETKDALLVVELDEPMLAEIRVLDPAGRPIITLLQGPLRAGQHEIEWDYGWRRSGNHTVVVEVGGIKWTNDLRI